MVMVNRLPDLLHRLQGERSPNHCTDEDERVDGQETGSYEERQRDEHPNSRQHAPRWAEGGVALGPT